MRNLEGKVAIVTGAGRGIGREHALALACDGAAVVVNDLGGPISGAHKRDPSPAEDVVAEILAVGGRAVADTSDIADWEEARQLVDTALSTFGRLDIVVNNAGMARFNTIDAISRDDWHRTIEVCLNGTGAVCHWAAAYWRERGPEAGRRIVNTSSSVGLTPQSMNPMYVAAKAGVAALTVATAIELASLGVRVNALAPAARTRVSRAVAPELMAEIPEGFDRMSPKHAATVMSMLVSPSCRFTGRIFGVVGDDITVFDGWTVAHYVSNGEQNWTPEALEVALSEVPVQQQTSSQAIIGVEDIAIPNDLVLEQLKAVEQKAGVAESV
ncbi:SDR family NAD(P)-dependent oxidoreductase [Rhodococcus qingshengii]|uniref:SDR family NAD(P)-dependent oxidoreductase n=1 Tax=Rhodococcus qingshengii TaxID=334542 RepID=UPI001BE81D51|nr:SDR family NAD(P)-dependent oxidoreductase [Rhodococcus qingshengii]MBT2269970.1 SDR family NAD(P)-dependent oxidoreductase [Rhodococcus qingshengii]